MTLCERLLSAAPPEWRVAFGAGIGDRLRERQVEIEAALDLDPTDLRSARPDHEGRVTLVTTLDTALEELESVLLRVVVLHIAIDRAPSKAQMRKTIRRLIAGSNDIAESVLRAAGRDFLELLGRAWPGAIDPPVAAMVVDQSTLRQVLASLAASLGPVHRGRDSGPSVAAAQLGLGLAELFRRFAAAPPTRRSRVAEVSPSQQKDYGPFLDLCRLAVDVLDGVVPAQSERPDAKRRSKLSAEAVARSGIRLFKERLAEGPSADGSPPNPARTWLVDPHLVSRSYLAPSPISCSPATPAKSPKTPNKIP